MTVATFKDLATQTHTVMGVSGTWIGSDDKLIAIHEQNAPIGKVLDDICYADPRFSWAQGSDGSIQIRLGREYLSLLDVVVSSVDGKAITSENLVSAVIMMPAVRSWAARNKCNVEHVIAIMGEPKKSFENTISILGDGQPLWRVLDRIAEKSGSYLWDMIKFSNEPCSINFNP